MSSHSKRRGCSAAARSAVGGGARVTTGVCRPVAMPGLRVMEVDSL